MRSQDARTDRARVPGVLAVAAAATALALAAGCGSDTEPKAPATTTAAQPATTAAAAPRKKLTRAQRSDARAKRLEPPLAFHLRRGVKLRARPNGKVLRRLGRRTVFRSPRIMAVAARRPGWVGVRTEALRNRIGWVPSGSGVYFSEPRTITIDLSRRQMTVRHRGRVSGRYRVAIGAPGTPTPTGRFAVTDRLHTGTKGSGPYGCCILALTGHQPKIAQGWGGGDRIAIHATAATWALGQAVSHGCVRASNETLRTLMRQIRLGTPVRIRA